MARHEGDDPLGDSMPRQHLTQQKKGLFAFDLTIVFQTFGNGSLGVYSRCSSIRPISTRATGISPPALVSRTQQNAWCVAPRSRGEPLQFRRPAEP